MKLDACAPPFDVIKSRVRYDSETGEFFAVKAAGKRSVGGRLGYSDGLGYWKLFIRGKWVLAHRLAWALSNNDTWPIGEIDHINGNPSDNRISNLRVASRTQNVANAKFNSLNTTGFRGVCAVRQARGVRYQADIRKDGKKVYLGIFSTPEEAHAAYVKAAKSIHGEFFAEDGREVFVPAPKQKPEQFDLLGVP